MSRHEVVLPAGFCLETQEEVVLVVTGDSDGDGDCGEDEGEAVGVTMVVMRPCVGPVLVMKIGFFNECALRRHRYPPSSPSSSPSSPSSPSSSLNADKRSLPSHYICPLVAAAFA